MASGQERAQPPRTHEPIRTTLAIVLGCVWIIAFWAIGTNASRAATYRVDFAQFYLIAALAADRDYAGLTDETRLDAERRARLPETTHTFPPVYGPHVALVLQPLARLSYPSAFVTWAVMSTFGWALCLVVLAREPRGFIDGWAALWAPLLYTLLNGQLSAIALGGFTLMVLGWRHRNAVVVGLGLAVLAYKPSLFVPALLLCALAGQARASIVAVGLATGALAASFATVGWDVGWAYIENLARFAADPGVLVSRPHLTVSLRTFCASVFGGYVGLAVYASGALAVVLLASRAMRSTESPMERAGVLAMAVALVTPHFYLYDLVILAPAYVAVFTREGGRAAIRWTGAGVALAPLLLPLAATSQIPVITPFLALWFAAWTGSRRNGSAVTAAQTPPGPPT